MGDALAQAAPDRAAELHEQGLAAARQHRLDQAATFFQQAIETNPHRIEAQRHLAQAYGDSGRLTEAEQAWQDYLALVEKPVADGTSADTAGEKPTASIADAWRHLGNLRKRMEKLDAAIEALQKAASLDPKSLPIQIDLGIALAQAKRRPQAREAFQTALTLQADSYDAMINLGMLLQEMGEGQEEGIGREHVSDFVRCSRHSPCQPLGSLPQTSKKKRPSPQNPKIFLKIHNHFPAQYLYFLAPANLPYI